VSALPGEIGANAAFPFDAVRDLLGVVRAIYAAAKERGGGRTELSRIARVGQELGRALDLAGAARQGAAGQEAAWRCVEGAMLEVSDLVDPLTPAAPIVRAARTRVASPRVALRKKQPPR
jgi:hypothetical protein